jgi:hypothetical protein
MSAASGGAPRVDELRREAGDDVQRAGARSPYEPPILTVYGRVADMTRKTGGPGNDNPGHRRSLP